VAASIKSLVCAHKNIQSIDELVYFKSLEYANFQNNSIATLPSLKKLTSITYLDVSTNILTQIPSLHFNKKITELILYSNRLSQLPRLDSLPELIYLDVVANNLTTLPPLDQCVKLEKLLCAKNQIEALPNLSTLANIKALDVSYNQIATFPDLTNCVNLTTFNINNNLLTQLPATIPALNHLQKMFLGNNYLTFSQLNTLLAFPNYASICNTFPQYPSSGKHTVTKLKGDSLSIETLTDNNTNGVYYTWYKNGTSIGTTAVNKLNLKSLTYADSGAYVCVLQSTLFPNISYTNDTLHLKVNNCIHVDSILIQKTNITCTTSGALQIHSHFSYKYQLISTETADTLSSNSGIFNYLDKSNYNLTVGHPNGCTVNYGTIKLERDECNHVLITPNDDGDGDEYYFTQVGIVKIFNKRGDLVKSMPIPGAWNATTKAGKVSQGFYVADINDGEKIIKMSIVY
jgi:hypothetical protein